MNISAMSNDPSTKKIIYKAKRLEDQLKVSKKLQIQEVNCKSDVKSIKCPLNSSPTPIKKFEKLQSPEASDKFLTQAIFNDDDEDIQIYGKRSRENIEIRDSKKFKGNLLGFSQKFIYLQDLVEKNVIGFQCFSEEDLKKGFFEGDVEQEEDDCPTSNSQIQFCKEFLEKELEDAILNSE